MSRPPIAVIGSLNTDLVARVDRFPRGGETLVGQDFQTYCGGKGANQAYAAARLGGEVAMIGRVGSDAFGKAQIENLSAAGVQTDGIQLDPAQPTGTAMIGVESSGENRIILVPGANHTLTAGRLESCRHLLSGAELILLQLEIPMEAVGAAIRLGRESRAQVILDPAPAAPIPPEWFPSIEYLTPNLGELSLLTADSLGEETPLETIAESALKLCARGARCVIAKIGSRGALRVTPETIEHWPARHVRAEDTTAAGDCFNAAFAVRRAAGDNVEDAGKFAVAAATLSVTRRGAQQAMPSRQEVEAFRQAGQSPGDAEP